MKKTIKIFQQIRDVHYRIPLSESEPNNCCSGKALRLKEELEKAGYSARYRVCDFKWSDLSLPEEILLVPHNDLTQHVYLEVQKEGEWLDVDPTWDSGLHKILPISEWDGKSSTAIAVKPIKLYSHKKSMEIMEQPDPEEEKEVLKKNVDFYEAFNDWLERERG